jgi:hypothetical protein
VFGLILALDYRNLVDAAVGSGIFAFML